MPEATLPAEGKRLIHPAGLLAWGSSFGPPSLDGGKWAVVSPHSCGAAPVFHRLPEHRMVRRLATRAIDPRQDAALHKIDPLAKGSARDGFGNADNGRSA